MKRKSNPFLRNAYPRIPRRRSPPIDMAQSVPPSPTDTDWKQVATDAQALAATMAEERRLALEQLNEAISLGVNWKKRALAAEKAEGIGTPAQPNATTLTSRTVSDFRASRPNVLFVVDRWCEGNINYGTSEFQNNLVGSLVATGLANKVLTFFPDDHWITHGARGDDELLRICAQNEIGLVVHAIYRMPGSDPLVPRHETLETIRRQMNIPSIVICGDIESTVQQDIMRSLLPVVDYIACSASSVITASLEPREKYIYTWVPKDPRVFFNDFTPRDIPVSYLGSERPERSRVIASLEAAGIGVLATGGERYTHLHACVYAELFRRSKITLSFSRNLGRHVTNARMFEATLCGAMVLEEDGIETPQLFKPMADYVPFTSPDDLVAKVKYYLSNEEQRLAIAESGCRTTHLRYSAQRYWHQIFQRIFFDR